MFSTSKPRARRTRVARLEVLETREMLSAVIATAVSRQLSTATMNWLNANVATAAIRNLTVQDLQRDSDLTRTDMMGILRQVEQAGAVTAAEFTDLKAVVQNSTLFVGLAYVQQLAGNVVLGNVANAHYQGAALGNLHAGSTATQLETLVDKWFLGTDHPLGSSSWGPIYAYRTVSGKLFAHSPLFTDVDQGGLGDCYFLASLAETAARCPSVINSMFIVNGDGTYTVRFYNNGQPEYVTVDSQLPTDSAGHFVFANCMQNSSNASNTLWVALAEKAYAQINEEGWIRTYGLSGSGQNAYLALAGGYIGPALNQITGCTGTYFNTFTKSTDFNSFAAAFNAGDLVGFGSVMNPSSPIVVGDHAYAVVGLKLSTRQITIYNPWGNNNGTPYPGTFVLTWTQVQANFDDWDYVSAVAEMVAFNRQADNSDASDLSLPSIGDVRVASAR
jgi:hypothetical protein